MTSCALQQAHASVSALSHQPLCGCGSSASQNSRISLPPGSGYGYKVPPRYLLHFLHIASASSHQHTASLSDRSQTRLQAGHTMYFPFAFSPFPYSAAASLYDSETRANLYDGLQDATTVLGEFGRMACGEVTSSIRGMAYGVVHQIVNIKTYIASNIVGGLQSAAPSALGTTSRSVTITAAPAASSAEIEAMEQGGKAEEEVAEDEQSSDAAAPTSGDARRI